LHLHFEGEVGGAVIPKEVLVTGKKNYKYAVFDIKRTYNHQMFISGIQLHLQNVSFEGGGSGSQTSDWEDAHLVCLPLKTAPGQLDLRPVVQEIFCQ